MTSPPVKGKLEPHLGSKVWVQMSNRLSGVSRTMLPLGTNHQVRYYTESGFGAVLVVRAPLYHDAVYHDAPCQEWVKDNAAVLFSGPRGEAALNRGLFIVTETYCTQQGSLTSWTGPGNEVFAGLDIEVVADGSIGLHMGWHAGRSSTGWNHFGSNVGQKIILISLQSFAEKNVACVGTSNIMPKES